jgi:hypothetical protein
MDNLIVNEICIYESKIENNSVKEKWVKYNLPNLYSFAINKSGKSLSEKIYLLKNNIGLCKACQSPTKFLSYTRGYRDYCCKKCSNNDIDLIKQRQESYVKNNLLKYGVDNISKLYITKEKISDSIKNTDRQKSIEKSKKTSLEKYGVDNVSKSEEIKLIKKNKNIKKYGVENVFQLSETKEKIKETLIKKYGVNHPLKSDDIKQKLKYTNLEKYGVENPSQSNVVKLKKMKSYNSGIIETTINKYENYIQYMGESIYELKCDEKDHKFSINTHLYHARKKYGNKLCTVCYPVNENRSLKEEILFNFISKIYDGEIIRGYRDGLEIDIYLPALKLGFEINGLYWHSEKYKDRNYHINKTNFFRERGIRIIHLWEDDLINKMDIIESQVKNWMGLNQNKIWARKCEIKEIFDTSILNLFLKQNHIQGYVRSSLKIGLFYKGELVSLMTFDHSEGRKTMLNDEWNLSRFCNKINTNVVGSASKLLTYFIKNFSPKKIISFADKDWSLGEIYLKLGFDKISESKPNYKYVINRNRVNKQRFKKSNLVKNGYDISKSESEIMSELGNYRVWDCGQIKFEKLIIE